MTHFNCYAVVSDPNNVENIQKKGVVNALGEGKLLISDKGKVEPEAIENIIQNDLFKTSFNLTKQHINKIVALLPAHNEELSIGNMVLRTRDHELWYSDLHML